MLLNRAAPILAREENRFQVPLADIDGFGVTVRHKTFGRFRRAIAQRRAVRPVERMRQRNYRVDRGGSLDYRRAAAQAVGVSSASR